MCHFVSMCDISLFLQHTLLLAIRVRRKFLRKVCYCKTNQKQKQATSYHNTNSTETKNNFYSTCYKIARPTGRVYKSPLSIAGGTDLGRGEIFVTLPFLLPQQLKPRTITEQTQGNGYWQLVHITREQITGMPTK
jgi:hypothetical protein